MKKLGYILDEQMINEMPHLGTKDGGAVDLGLEVAREDFIKQWEVLYRFVKIKQPVISHVHGGKYKFDYDSLTETHQHIIEDWFRLANKRVDMAERKKIIRKIEAEDRDDVIMIDDGEIMKDNKMIEDREPNIAFIERGNVKDAE